MTNTASAATRNIRMEELRNLAGLGTEGAYEVRSVSTLTGRYNVIGRTDDVAAACDACEAIAGQAVPCETFTANRSLGVFA